MQIFTSVLAIDTHAQRPLIIEKQGWFKTVNLTQLLTKKQDISDDTLIYNQKALITNVFFFQISKGLTFFRKI